MNKIYADNAATSYPKPKEVGTAVYDYIENIGANASRGFYENSLTADRVIYNTRELLCQLFNFDIIENAIFTMNITHSLNTIIKGILKSGDHVIVSSMEHNAVMRPLGGLIKKGIGLSRVQCNKDGTLNPENLEDYIKPNTKLVIMTHVSNVCGTILPIKEIGEVCKNHGIYFVLDSAQSAGVLDIDFKSMGLSALAFTGHKGLLAPQGVGGFLVSEAMANEINPFLEGGTGSFSSLEEQPQELPDKFEAGTMNLPGIFGLNAALKYLKKIGIQSIYEKEEQLSKRFLDRVLNIEGINLTGIKGAQGRTSVFSMDFLNKDNSEAAFILNREFGIMTRVGLHCAPSAHKTLGTYPQGTVRFSFGSFNTVGEIDYIAESISSTLKML